MNELGAKAKSPVSGSLTGTSYIIRNYNILQFIYPVLSCMQSLPSIILNQKWVFVNF
jgi:hypothetical protein